MLATLLLLLSLPLSRSLVARHSTRPDLTPVLRLKGGAGFNQWLRLFKVVVKGAKGGARNAQRGPAARASASRAAVIEQGASFSRLLSVPATSELALASGLASGPLARAGSNGGTTLAATTIGGSPAMAARPPAAGGPATTSTGVASRVAAISTRSLDVCAPRLQCAAASVPGVAPSRGTDLPTSDLGQCDSTASRYSSRYSNRYSSRYSDRYSSQYSSAGYGSAAGSAALALAAGAAPSAAPGAAATPVLLEVAIWS